jgi:hypothetical protein
MNLSAHLHYRETLGKTGNRTIEIRVYKNYIINIPPRMSPKRLWQLGLQLVCNNEGPSPSRAKTYGKEPLCPSTWESCASEKCGISGMPRDIAQNYGVHVAVGAMFVEHP